MIYVNALKKAKINQTNFIILGVFISVILSNPAAAEKIVSEPLTPITSLDLPKYMGRWYEISKFPNWFQRKCVSETHADYSIEPEGTVQVINRCRLDNGDINLASGKARQIGSSYSAKLEVSFAPEWLSFIPALWGDYWVIDLDAEYKLVAISEPRRKYLWVLSRSPKVDQFTYDALLERLRLKGFDIDKLEYTTHPN